MTKTQKTLLGSAITVLLSVAIVLGILAFLPSIGAQLGYAIESGQSRAAAERLSAEDTLSNRFGDVAKMLRPSVVSISSVKRFEAERYGQRPDVFPQLPEQFRDFFGDDGLERFFEAPPRSQGFQQQGLGSGVVISSDGFVLTNNHVVQGADEVNVTLSSGRRLKAEVVGTDPPTDLAVLRIKASDLTPATIGDSAQTAVGQWVLAIGSPMGLEQTVTAGIVSAKGRANLNISDYEDFVQTDAAINPGNSGGPLVNLKGEVIAINTAIASRTGGNMGIGFAIPSNMASAVKDAIISDGKVERGQIGALIQNLTQDMAESFGYDGTDGVLIGDVVEGSPAAEAGLKAGDIVVEFDGKPVTQAHELRNRVAATAPGRKASLKVFRDQEYKTLDIQIGTLTNGTSAVSSRESPAKQTVEELGIVVNDLTAELRQQLELSSDKSGAVVTQIQPGSLAYIAGIRAGDLIISVDETKIDNVADFRKALAGAKLDQGIRLRVERAGAKRFVFLKRSA